MNLNEAKNILIKFIGFIFKRKEKKSKIDLNIEKIKKILINEYKMASEDAKLAFSDASDKYWDYIDIESPEYLADRIYEYWKHWKGNSPYNFYD